jgi:hypothetical protein
MLPQLGRPCPLLHLLVAQSPPPGAVGVLNGQYVAVLQRMCEVVERRNGNARIAHFSTRTKPSPVAFATLLARVLLRPAPVFAPLPMHSAACTTMRVPTAQSPSFRWQVELPVPSLHMLPVPVLEPLLLLRTLLMRSSRAFSKPPSRSGGRRSASPILALTSVSRVSVPTTTSKASAGSAARARCMKAGPQAHERTLVDGVTALGNPAGSTVSLDSGIFCCSACST